jgi:hypothetical protein
VSSVVQRPRITFRFLSRSSTDPSMLPKRLDRESVERTINRNCLDLSPMCRKEGVFFTDRSYKRDRERGVVSKKKIHSWIL